MKQEISQDNLRKVIQQFQFEGELIEADYTGNGHINDTFLIEMAEEKKYILQRINHHIFKQPKEVMANIEKVCGHIQGKLEAMGEAIERQVLILIPTKEGEILFKDEAGYYWRAYLFVTNAISYDVVPNNTIFYNCGKAFGQFQKFLADFEASKLYETIPSFHDTRSRYSKFLEAVKKDVMGRSEMVKDEIQFVIDHKEDTESLLKLYEAGEIPLRVTHNDTKINNVMVDKDTKEGICVIDLDTVMPGLAAYDFGDSIRTGATTGEEDEVDLSKVNFMPDRLEVFAKGFLEAVGEDFDKTEIYSLLIGAKVMTLECGMRFLTDYLEGDHYFKIHRTNHNLDRARTQFKLVKDMEEQWEELEAIIKKFM